MRYWAYFAAKLVVAAAVLIGLLALLNRAFDPRHGASERASARVTRPRLGIRANPPEFSPEGGSRAAVGPQPVPSIETEEQAAQERAQAGEEMRRRFGPQIEDGVYLPPRFGWDLGYTLTVLVWFLFSTGTLYVIIWDQRYRCRVCLRRLRMPIETGSWTRMLQFGRPRIEYICPYGHGTLKEDELQISGHENPEWTPHSDDLWDELCASSKESGDQP